MAGRRSFIPGDVFELRTPSGLAYLQFTHVSERMGQLISVLAGVHDERPADVESLAAGEEQFRTFIPLGAAVSGGLVEHIGTASIPTERAEFPTFRSGTPDRDGHVAVWWLWDGEREWKAEESTEEMREFPLEEIINHEMLVERIETGWRHRDHPQPPDVIVREREQQAADAASEPVGPAAYRFFLYFPDEARAARAAEALSGDGFEVERPAPQDEDAWPVIAGKGVEGEEIFELDDRLEALAHEHGGEYDGSEVALPSRSAQ